MPHNSMIPSSSNQDLDTLSRLQSLTQPPPKPYKELSNPITSTAHDVLTRQYAEDIQEKESTIALQEACMNELERENQILNDSNVQLRLECTQLTTQMRALTETISRLSKEIGIMQQRNEQLERQLQGITDGRITLTQEQQRLQQENVRLANRIEALMQEQQAALALRETLSQQVQQFEAATNNHDHQLRHCKTDVQHLKERLQEFEQKNRVLSSKLDDKETQERMEAINNQEDPIALISAVAYTALGVCAFGGLIPGLMMGGAIEVFHIVTKHRMKTQLERAVNAQAAAHPNSSKKQCLEQVLANQPYSKVSFLWNLEAGLSNNDPKIENP